FGAPVSGGKNPVPGGSLGLYGFLAGIQGCCNHNHDALDDELSLDRHAKQQNLICENDYDPGSCQRAMDRTAATAHRHPADHAGDDGVELVALPHPVVDEPDIAAEDKPSDHRETARDQVAGDGDGVGADAEQASCHWIAADDEDLAPKCRAMQYHREHCR